MTCIKFHIAFMEMDKKIVTMKELKKAVLVATWTAVLVVSAKT